MNLKTSSGKWLPLCLGLNVLIKVFLRGPEVGIPLGSKLLVCSSFYSNNVLWCWLGSFMPYLINAIFPFTCSVGAALYPMCGHLGWGDAEGLGLRGRYPDNKVYAANMGPTWGRQDPGGPHVGPMNLAIWVGTVVVELLSKPVLINHN